MAYREQMVATLRSILRRFGYDVCRAEERRDPFDDMRKLTKHGPVVFDVGANAGSVVKEFRRTLSSPTIHAFEASPATFEVLRRNCAGTRDVVLNCCALGAKAGVAEFQENSESTMSSFLDLGKAAWGEIQGRTRVQLRTIDDYCDEHAISHINILKSDTQGYDLEVLRGGASMLARGRIDLVYIEINFVDLYKGQPRPEVVMGFLAEHGFDPVHFYRFQYWNQRVGWTDVLFQRRGSIEGC
jgi:FkbM family methyltransferase